MARIRSIKPEFWEDETVAVLGRDARLLFIACWNLADDEGLLRWTPEFLKANAFMYDDDIDAGAVEKLMLELVEHSLVMPYRGGKVQQRLGWVVNFHKHQRINRPTPSKLPPPSLQNPAVKRAYAERDGWVCSVCNEVMPSSRLEIRMQGGDLNNWVSMDHVIPRSKGGTDYPSNIALAHKYCNSSKGATCDVLDPLSDSRTDSVSDSVSDSPPEVEGEREVEGEQEETPPSTSVDKRDDSFEHFWDAWPRRNGKKLARDKAERAWSRMTLDERRAAYIGAQYYAAASEAGLAGAMDAFRWLRDRAWPDWQEPATPSSRDGPSKAAQMSAAYGAAADEAERRGQ